LIFKPPGSLFSWLGALVIETTVYETDIN